MMDFVTTVEKNIKVNHFGEQIKLICLRCLKEKRGVHYTVVMGTNIPLCNKCSTKVMNLISLYRNARSDSYKTQLVYLMFHAVGFTK